MSYYLRTGDPDKMTTARPRAVKARLKWDDERKTKHDRHRRNGEIRQYAAARRDCRAMRARKPRACLGNGGGAERNHREARPRLRLQDLVRQSEPDQRSKRPRLGSRQGAY